MSGDRFAGEYILYSQYKWKRSVYPIANIRLRKTVQIKQLEILKLDVDAFKLQWLNVKIRLHSAKSSEFYVFFYSALIKNTKR